MTTTFRQVIYKNRSMAYAFLINVGLITICDRLFNLLLKNEALARRLLISVDYAPEVWFALLAMVLGTLIIVISIASQSIIKLIDLYMRDWISLMYIWFMLLATAHIILIYDSSSISKFLNINIFLLGSFLFAFPYIFYILRLTKPEIITAKIKAIVIRDINEIIADTVKGKRKMAKGLYVVYQKRFFDSLNQLDDLLNYIPFKETKSIILRNLSDILIHYLRVKPLLPKEIFSISDVMKADISYRTMAESFEGQSHYPYFFEKKILRILGNAYAGFIEFNQFDLATLTASEVVQIVRSLDLEDHSIYYQSKGLPSHSRWSVEDLDEELDLMSIHLNTFFRFAFKHAVKENEQRNLYNLAYYYRLFLEYLAQIDRSELLVKSFQYLQYYGNECFKVASHSKLYFIVDTIAFEMKQILIDVHDDGFPKDVQERLLNYFLQVDKPPEFIGDEKNIDDVITSKVRMIQISMGLYYMYYCEDKFVDMIIDDVLEDIKVLGKKKFKVFIDKIFFLLEIFGKTFWEDTDRSNINIYFTEHKEFIDRFKEKLFRKMNLSLDS